MITKEKYRVGSGTKVNEISEELESESHFGQRILGGIDGTDVEDLIGAEFDLLFGAGRRELQVAVEDDTCSGGNELAEFAERGFDDDLEVAGAASVVDFQERESVLVGFASRLHPAADARLPAGEARAAVGAGDDGSDGDAVGEISFGNLVEGDGGELIHQWRRCVCHWC